MAKEPASVQPRDLSYMIVFFDEEWNEIPEMMMTVKDLKSWLRIAAEWRERRAQTWGKPANSFYGIAKVHAIGMEVVYV